MTAYVLNLALTISDDKALAAAATAARRSPADVTKLRPEAAVSPATRKARDVEAIVVAALRASGCSLERIRVEIAPSPPDGAAFDEFDVAFVTDPPPPRR